MDWEAERGEQKGSEDLSPLPACCGVGRHLTLQGALPVGEAKGTREGPRVKLLWRGVSGRRSGEPAELNFNLSVKFE